MSTSSSRRGPRPTVGSSKVLLRKPSAAAAAAAAAEIKEKQDASEQRAKEAVMAAQIQKQRAHLLECVPASSPAVLPDPRFAALGDDRFSDEFLSGLNAAEIRLESVGGHRELRARMIAKTVVETFDATIMMVFKNALRDNNDDDDSLAAIATTTTPTTPNSPTMTNSSGSVDINALSFLENCAEPLLESSAAAALDALVLELCQKTEVEPGQVARQQLNQAQVAGINSIGIDACLSSSCLSAAAAWRLQVCKVCSAAVVPIVDEIESKVRNFCLLVQQEQQQKQQQQPQSSGPPAAELASKASSTFSDIEKLLVPFRRILGAWRHCQKDLHMTFSTAVNRLQPLRAFAAAEALLYQARILLGDAAREEAAALSVAHVLHELLAHFVRAVVAVKNSQDEKKESAGSRKRSPREVKTKKSTMLEQQQTGEVVEQKSSSALAASSSSLPRAVRQGKAELKIVQPQKTSRGGSGRGCGRGRGRGRNDDDDDSNPLSPVVPVDSEYSRAALPGVQDRTQMPLFQQQQARPSMQAVSMFKPRGKNKAVEEAKDAEEIRQPNSSQDGVSSSFDSEIDEALDQLSDPDYAEEAVRPPPPLPFPSASAETGSPPASSESPLVSVLSALSPAGIDRLLMVRRAELPLFVVDQKRQQQAGGGTGAGGEAVTFSKATAAYRSAILECPWRGSAYDRLSSLYSKYPGAFQEQVLESSLEKGASAPFTICHCSLRAAAASVDPIPAAADRAMRHLRKAARDVKRKCKKASSVLDCTQQGVVSVPEALLALTAPFLQRQEKPQMSIRQWTVEIGQLLLQHVKQQELQANLKLDGPASMLFLRFAELVLIAANLPPPSDINSGNNNNEELRVQLPLSLAEVFCDLLLALHQQQADIAVTSLPTAIALLVDAAYERGMSASSSFSCSSRADLPQHQNIKQQQNVAENGVLYDDDEDEVVFVPPQPKRKEEHIETAGGVARLLPERTKLLQVRDCCDCAHLQLASAGVDGTSGERLLEFAVEENLYITCDDAELFGLPIDASLLCHKDSPWWSSSRGSDNNSSAGWRNLAVRAATKVTPSEFRVLASGTRAPPHRHDDKPRHFADKQQTLALRSKRLSDLISKVLR